MKAPSMNWAVGSPACAALTYQVVELSGGLTILFPSASNSSAKVSWDVGSPASAPFLASATDFFSSGLWLPAAPPGIVNLILARIVQGTATPFTFFGVNPLLKMSLFAD